MSFGGFPFMDLSQIIPAQSDSELLRQLTEGLVKLIDETEALITMTRQAELDESYADRLIRDIQANAYIKLEFLLISFVSPTDYWI